VHLHVHQTLQTRVQVAMLDPNQTSPEATRRHWHGL